MKIELRDTPASDCDRAGGFLQSAFWGAFKAEFGWRPLHFTTRIGGLNEALVETGSGASAEVEAPLLVLERSLGPGHGPCFAYVPHGPELEVSRGDRAALLAALAEALRPYLPPLCLFLRFDPPWYDVEEIPAAKSLSSNAYFRPEVGRPMRRAAADIQPPDTVLLDLRKSEDELLSAMKPKWRYNIRLAEKKGVAVEVSDAGGLDEFYCLYEETARRDRIALHPKRYYARLFSLAAGYDSAARSRPDLRLWIARYEGEALAAIVTLYRGDRAVYLYGASSDERRNLMPAYALQWAAIRAAKEEGCAEYDFYGIPPVEDLAHPMAGLYRFKTGFGGKVIHRSGSWDYPLRPSLYAAFRAAETARNWWFKDFKKRLGRGGGE